MWFLQLYMSVGLFFSLYYHIHDLESERRYPSTMGSINRKLTDVYQTTLHSYCTLKENTMAGSLQTVLLSLSLGKPKYRFWKKVRY